MLDLTAWATQWGVPQHAMTDLRHRLGALDAPGGPEGEPLSEAAVQSRARVRASRQGMCLWRNNVGAFHDQERNTFVRFGLANDSAQVNRVVKSADLIGIRPVLITPAHLGRTIGQFVSLECKHGGWKWTGSEREIAQHAWALRVAALGGDGRFISDADQL